MVTLTNYVFVTPTNLGRIYIAWAPGTRGISQHLPAKYYGEDQKNVYIINPPLVITLRL